MSSLTFEAVYENGLLRPMQTLPLKSDEHVTITLHLTAEADWPEDTDEIYREIEAEDRELASKMWQGVQNTWPENGQ